MKAKSKRRERRSINAILNNLTAILASQSRRVVARRIKSSAKDATILSNN
jgi:hypothetical protein